MAIKAIYVGSTSTSTRQSLNSAVLGETPRRCERSFEVRLMRGQCLALLNAEVATNAELEALSDEHLIKCVGKATAAILRPRMASDAGAESWSIRRREPR